MGNIMNCKNCGHPLSSTHRFCANCGSAVSEQMSALSPIETSKSEPTTESHVEESIVEIRLKKPVMIGKYQLSSVFYGLACIFAGTFFITSVIKNESNIPLVAILFILITGLFSLFGSGVSVRNRCPHCRKKIEYNVAHDVIYECPYCYEKIKIDWK